MGRLPDAPDGESAVPGIRRRLLWAVPVLVAAAAGLVGWYAAGPPGDEAALVPPECPAVDPVTLPRRAHQGAGAAEHLVPMPLPEPRGPVSVRVCAYEQRGSEHVLRTSTVVEPVRTAALAGLLNNAPGPLVADGTRPPHCAPGREIAVLVFRYTQGPAQQVDVLSGTCALVTTPARAERDRGDVVREVTGLLAGPSHPA